MSQDNTTGTNELEEKIILSVLAGEMEAEAEAGEEEERLRREYTELAGLLPYGLDPVAPSPQLRERLMAAVGGREASGNGESRAPGAARPEVPALRRTSFWPLALAAAVSLLMVGLSTLLYVQLRSSQSRLAGLEQELAAVESREEQLAARLARVNEELAGASERLAILTQPGAEACPLRPVGEEPLQPVARGILYIAADHQHWYLKVTGLEPVPPGKEYQVWFMTGDGPVSAGVLHAANGEEAELGSPTMPVDTRAVAVTVEPAGGAPAPSGSTVLFGDEKMELL